MHQEKNEPKAVDLTMSQMGGHNCHVDIVFEDGGAWVAGIRLIGDETLVPRQVADYILSSEIATIFYIARTTVRLPKMSFYTNE